MACNSFGQTKIRTSEIYDNTQLENNKPPTPHKMDKYTLIHTDDNSSKRSVTNAPIYLHKVTPDLLQPTQLTQPTFSPAGYKYGVFLLHTPANIKLR